MMRRLWRVLKTISELVTWIEDVISYLESQLKNPTAQQLRERGQILKDRLR